MRKIPYPPAPEPGWYDDDVVTSTPIDERKPVITPQTLQQPTSADINAENGSAAVDLSSTGTQELDQVSANSSHQHLQDLHIEHGEPDEYVAESGAQGSDEWDGTVLSTAFVHGPHRNYTLTNDVTHQQIAIDMNTLLGRKPSHDIPEGSKSVRLLDPTKTVSRDHCAISFGEHGTLWLEDMGSLNGTFLTEHGEEIRVQQGKPEELHVPATIRIGDQFFTLDVSEDPNS